MPAFSITICGIFQTASIMRTTLFLTALSVCSLSLTACGDAENDTVSQTVDRQLRSSFITVASKKCISRIPQDRRWLSPEKVRQICDCTSGKIYDSVSAQDLADILAGNINQELTEQLSKAAMACAEENIRRPDAAPAAASEIRPPQ